MTAAEEASSLSYAGTNVITSNVFLEQLLRPTLGPSGALCVTLDWWQKHTAGSHQHSHMPLSGLVTHSRRGVLPGWKDTLTLTTVVCMAVCTCVHMYNAYLV